MASYTYKALNRGVGKALHRYDMISNGDRIAVGLSGGKDSLVLLWILNERQSRVPIRYELFPIYIDPGFEGGFGDSLKNYCSKMGYSYSSGLAPNDFYVHRYFYSMEIL